MKKDVYGREQVLVNLLKPSSGHGKRALSTLLRWVLSYFFTLFLLDVVISGAEAAVAPLSERVLPALCSD